MDDEDTVNCTRMRFLALPDHVARANDAPVHAGAVP